MPRDRGSIMKTIITTLALLLPLAIFGQNSCSKYYPFKEGSVSTYEMLNKKGKTDGTISYTISNVDDSGSSTTATVTSELFDKKGKSVMSSEYEMDCNGTSVTINFKSLMNADMMKQLQNGEVEITGTNIEIPNELEPGQTLPDSGINITIKMGGINMKMNTQVTGRKVVGTETVTTAAGTFDCVVITQDTEAKVMIANTRGSQKTWLAEGVGVVKTESYNANGNLQNTTVLTAFSQ